MYKQHLFFLVSCLSRLLGGSPVQRVHAWLRKVRLDSLVSAGPRSESVGPSQIFPTHLPSSPMASVSPKGSRCRRCWLSRVAAWQLTEWLVALLTYCELGCPQSITQLASALGSWQNSTKQNTAISEFFEGTIYFCRAQPSEDWSRGRNTLYDTLTLFRSNNVAVGDVSSCSNVVAKQVRSEHISLPPTAGILGPCATLCPERHRVLRDMSKIIETEEQWPNPLPRRCFMVGPAKDQGLRRTLVGCGLASLLAEDEVPVDSHGRKLLAGVLAVPHKSDSDRSFDRRPQNATEHRLQWCTLPHSSLLTQIRRKPNEHVRGSGDDLSNSFYLLSHQPNWRSRNAFDRVFSGADAAALGGDPRTRYHLCLNVLGCCSSYSRGGFVRLWLLGCC